MPSPGEEFVGEYLRHICECEFIQYNLQTRHTQGEIDVVGINLQHRKLFVCEVAVHLATGLQYTNNKRPNNVEKLTDKFIKGVDFARSDFPSFEHCFMLWSPIVKRKKNPIYDQLGHLEEIQRRLLAKRGVEMECYINSRFKAALDRLRVHAASTTASLASPITRLLQIQEHLALHLEKADR